MSLDAGDIPVPLLGSCPYRYGVMEAPCGTCPIHAYRTNPFGLLDVHSYIFSSELFEKISACIQTYAGEA